MSTNSNIVVNGSVKINNLPDLACFTSFEELLKALPNYLTVEIPGTITNVIISNIQPMADQTDALWIRRSNSGSFIGLYLFSGGSWQQIYPVPNQLSRVYGNSGSIPPGYVLASTVYLTVAQMTFLTAQWHETSPGSGVYDIFDVIYVGF